MTNRFSVGLPLKHQPGAFFLMLRLPPSTAKLGKGVSSDPEEVCGTHTLLHWWSQPAFKGGNRKSKYLDTCFVSSLGLFLQGRMG